MKKEIKKVADELLEKGKKVFINEKEELFTDEGLARLSKCKYKEYTGKDISFEDKTTDSKTELPKVKNYFKMKEDELLQLLIDKGIDAGEAKTQKEYAKLLTDFDKTELEKAGE